MCSKCKTSKNYNCFSKLKSSKDGYAYYCKNCINTWHKQYYSLNRNEINQKHKENYIKYGNNWKTTRKKYYTENKTYLLDIQKDRLKNPNVKFNRNKVAAVRDKIRRSSDPGYRIKKTMRTRIWHALKGTYKSNTTEKLIGCSFEDLKIYIEKKFTDGMNWENYGKWHIDHIIPCASFDLTKLEEQCKCFHYTNLQPLWAKDNIKKSNIIV